MSRQNSSFNAINILALKAAMFSLLIMLSPPVSALSEDLQCGGPFGGVPPDGHEFGTYELTSYFGSYFNLQAYDEIVNAVDEWRDKGCRLKSGEPPLDFLLSGFIKAFDAEGDWQKSFERIELFKAIYPKSELPILAETIYWSEYAWNARGSGFSSSVTPEGWRLFQERLVKSESILLDSENIRGNSPQWYWQMIRVQALLDRPEQERYETFRMGTEKFRDFMPIYAEMATTLEPRWGGSWAAVDRIILLATKNIREETPDAIYTRMYWATGDNMSSDAMFFSETKVSWSRMRKGFESLLKLYPTSAVISNNFLAYACTVNDKATYLKYRKRTKALYPGAWRAERSRALCDAKFGFAG